MKKLLILALGALATLLAAPVTVAQAPPGWGWVNQLGQFVLNVTQQNNVAGLGRDAAGNLYLLGTYMGAPVLSGTPTTNAGESDVFLAKYSPTGALLWLRLLQSPDADGATALVVEPSGRCTVAGNFGGGRLGGNLQFTGFANATTLAGPAVWGLAATPLGYGAIPFVAAIDASGALLWADTPSPTYGIGVRALHRDGSGNCYVSVNTSPQSLLTVSGQNYPPIGTTDAVLIKYTAAGLPTWVRRVGVTNGSGYSGEVYTDNANAVYWLVGHNGTMSIDQVTVGVSSSNGAMSLVKLSATNRVRWIKNDLLQVGATNVVSQLLAFDAGTNALYLSGGSTGGAISFIGGSPVPVAANAFTACIARCDTAGQVQWVKPYMYAANVPGGVPGPRGAGIRGFAVRGNGFTLATNTVSYNATTYYGSPKTYGLAESGLPCALHFNTSTNQAEWVRVGGTPAAVNQPAGSDLKAAAIDAADNVFVAGTFQGTAQFGATTISSTTTTQPEIFLAKLDQTILTAATASAAGPPWSVFPNPSAGTAQLVGLPAQARVRVVDAVGRVVQQLPAASRPDAPRTLNGLRPGLYLLQVSNTAVPYHSQRLVVQ